MLTKDELAQLLREAEIAHHEYEQTLKPLSDENWPQWYADFVVEKLKADRNKTRHLLLGERVMMGGRPIGWLSRTAQKGGQS